ncbi:MAG: hypothetical protein PHH09_04595 [Methanoregulaceae archaeon]|nr:hypothetical protein [Methanoregulaceae archaeon]
MMANLGDLEAYCRQCGYVPPPGKHHFKCPECGYDKGWGLRGKKRVD